MYGGCPCTWSLVNSTLVTPFAVPIVYKINVLLGSSMCQCGFASGKQSSDFVFSQVRLTAS